MQFAYMFYNCEAHDRMSCPALYFDFGSAPEPVHFQNYQGGDAIFGGGGLIWSKAPEPFSVALNQKNALRIMWGVGINYEMPVEYPEWANEFDLVGLRDYGNPWHYVPCVSCMHPLFDLVEKSAAGGVTAIDHFEHKLNRNVIRANTWIDYPKWWEFEAEVRAIAQASVVVTRSYHAAYYSMLLNKPVVVVDPWNCKFHTFKYPPTFCSASGLGEAIAIAQPPPLGFLTECRLLNCVFFDKVKALLHE